MQVYLPIAEVSVNALLLFGLGGLVGLLSGLFGVGGGFLITPLLLFIWNPKKLKPLDWRSRFRPTLLPVGRART